MIILFEYQKNKYYIEKNGHNKIENFISNYNFTKFETSIWFKINEEKYFEKINYMSV